MGKQSKQEFTDFADEMNQTAPFRHTVRGLGVSRALEAPDDTKASDELDQLVSRISDKITQETSKGLESGSSFGLSELLKADIRGLLEPSFRSDKSETIVSMLDTVTLGLTDEREIRRFLARHGVDIGKEADMQYANNVLQEAARFFNEVIANGASKDKLNTALTHTDTIEGICSIFQTAAGKKLRHITPQACGLLRIAAAIDFLNRDPLLSILPEAEKELHRLYSLHFIRKGNKRIFTTRIPGEIPVEILRCELRTKTRERMIAKLLHKPKNKAEEVTDHIGMRVTTNSAFDALRFLYFAFYKPDTAIFPGMTVNIAETKQLLLDETKLTEALQNPRKARELVNELAVSTVDHAELSTMENGDNNVIHNKHSSEKYRAIHLTFDLPVTRSNGERAYFPVEMQIVDNASRTANESEAPHEDYVARQQAAIRERVLSNNLLEQFKAKKDLK